MRLDRTLFAVLVVFAILVTAACQICAQTAAQAWLQRYPPPGSGLGTGRAVAIAVGTNGTVFVTGYLSNGTNDDYVTLAYSNAGILLWTNRYDAPGNLSALPGAIAVDRSGNVFVTGSSFLLPGSPAGHPTDYSYVTVAYSGSGVPLWTNIYSVAGKDRAVAMAVDQDGNVFVTGNSVPSTTSYANMTTIAYSSAGASLWTNRYIGVGDGGASDAGGIAVDSKGNVFVAGYSYDAANHEHYAVIAYSNAGTPLWTNQYIGPTTTGDAASAVAVDSGGNVFVTGSSYNTTGFYDYLTVAYSGGGMPLWTNRYSTGNASAADAIAVDSGGNVFVTGYSWSGVGFPDYATVAYSGTGAPLWTNRYDGPVQRSDQAIAVAADGHGNVLVTGYSTGVTSNYDYVTIGYSSGGVPLWTNRYNGPGNGTDQAAGIAVDASGNVFVTGSYWNGTDYDIATIKYSLLQAAPIVIQQLGDQVVLSWTNTLFDLQTAPTLLDAFTNVPGATSPYTNNLTGGQRYFRLISK